MSLGYDPNANSAATAPGTVGAQLQAESPNADTGNTHTQTASGTGTVIGGDASAKTSMGGGGGGGGGGSGGGGGGYSLGQSNADSTTQSLGFSGSFKAGNAGYLGFGDFNPNFGGTQSIGLTGKTIAIIGACVAVVLLFLGRKG